MREIKFRAWDKKLGQMYIGSSEARFANGKFTVGKLILMQYTGLKDKNGKVFYEGDIVKDEENSIGLVEFLHGSFTAWCMELRNIVFVLEKQLEVIGNIYENPELLK